MFIISFHFWFRDLLRELNKKYEVLLIILFLVFLLFLVSEGLLFVSFFWTSFHSLSSPSLGIWPGEGFYVPDPCELTFANTLLLSNAAISLGNAFISLEISCSLLIFFSLFSFILAWTFISLQIKEFRIMGLSINDSVYSCVFFFLTGLHFFHLVVGLLLLSLLFWSCSLSSGITYSSYILMAISLYSNVYFLFLLSFTLDYRSLDHIHCLVPHGLYSLFKVKDKEKEIMKVNSCPSDFLLSSLVFLNHFLDQTFFRFQDYFPFSLYYLLLILILLFILGRNRRTNLNI